MLRRLEGLGRVLDADRLQVWARSPQRRPESLAPLFTAISRHYRGTNAPRDLEITGWLEKSDPGARPRIDLEGLAAEVGEAEEVEVGRERRREREKREERES